MNKYFLLLLGIISGIISYFSLYIGPDTEFGWFGPGVVFGIALAFYFIRRGVSSLWRIVVFIISSSVAYFAAVHTCLALVASADYLAVPLFFAGLVGSSILILCIHFVIIQMRLISVFFLVIAGGLLGLSYLLPMSFDGSDDISFFSLYIIWQTGMAFGIGWATKNKLKK